MNASIYCANIRTDVNIVCVALIGAILIAMTQDSSAHWCLGTFDAG